MFDTLQILFNTNFKITDSISVRHSTIDDIVRLGEERYFQTLTTITSIPSDTKSFLWDIGIDWVEISDLEYFAMMVKDMPLEDSGIFLPNVDFSKFELYVRPDGDKIFANKTSGQIIDIYVYQSIMKVLCTIHNIKKKPERPGDRLAREWLIEDDREKRKINAAKEKEYKSTLAPLVSAMVNQSGFKYNYQTVRELSIGQFMDAVSRIQIINTANQLIQGCYAGNIDMKKLDKKKLDWTREI